VFASWIFHGLNTFILFYFRRKVPAPAYRTPAFPWPPLMFIACSILLIVNTLGQGQRKVWLDKASSPRESRFISSSALPLSDRRKIDR
jgi:hypothetical protein